MNRGTQEISLYIESKEEHKNYLYRQSEKGNTRNISIDRVKGKHNNYLYRQSEKGNRGNISIYRVKRGRQEISLYIE